MTHSESRWNHNICDGCWAIEQPERVPSRLVEKYRETVMCCWCGKETRSGIFIRADPAEVHPDGVFA